MDLRAIDGSVSDEQLDKNRERSLGISDPFVLQPKRLAIPEALQQLRKRAIRDYELHVG